MNKAIPKLPKGVDFEDFENKGAFFSDDKKALEAIRKKLASVKVYTSVELND